ncbi:MAG: phosphate ABC transporter permease PstA [Candidatus Margulisiibacteriota bacterium]
MRKANIAQAAGFIFITLTTVITVAFLVIILSFIIKNGYPAISWEFLTQVPRNAMTAGGIGPAIAGTLYLTIGAIFFAVPLGVITAIFLNEYSPKGYTARVIRTSIYNLAGVPSVVFGLFGLAVFVKMMDFGVSILSGSLTLGILVLPAIISASQEALMAVPQSYREASLALGATHWETIREIVIPHALPGILTGIILGIGRVAGETAPIMFTAATFYTRGYPDSAFSEVMTLSYHIYALMTEGTHPQAQTQIAYGCALVLVLLVLSVSGIAVFIRQRQRRAHI